MKKIILTLLGLLLVLSIGYYFSRRGWEAAPAYYGGYLPADTLLTLRVDHFDQVADNFAASPLGYLFSRETMDAILADLQAGDQVIHQYDQLHDEVVATVSNPSFRTFLGDDMVLALLPPDRELMARAPEEALRRSLVLFATSAASGSLDTFARMVMSSNVTTETVEGRELTRVELDSGETFYGSVDGRVVLIGLDPEPVLTCLQTKSGSGQGQSLLTSPWFQNSRHLWQEHATDRTYLRMHVNVERMHGYFTDRPGQGMQEIERYLQGLSTAAGVVFVDDGRLVMAGRLHWQEGKSPCSTDPDGRKNISLHLLGPETLLYSWGLGTDLVRLSQDPLVREQEEYQRIDQVLGRELGVSLEELEAVFGPQYGLVVQDVATAAFFPLPKVLLFCQVRDRQKAAAIVDRLRELIHREVGVTEKQLPVAGKTLYYWQLLPGDLTQLVLAMDDDLLLVGNSRVLLKQVLQDDQARDTPLAFTLDTMVRKALLGADYSIGVVRPARLASRIRDPLDWVASIVSASSGIVLDRLDEELLTLFSTLEIVSSTTRVFPDHLDTRLILVPVSEN